MPSSLTSPDVMKLKWIDQQRDSDWDCGGKPALAFCGLWTWCAAT